jgi:uncharacterized protein (TIRG00374 family)
MFFHLLIRSNKTRTLALRVILSAGLIAFLLYTIDVGAFQARLAQLDLGYLTLAFAVAMADRVLMASKWRLLLTVKGIHIAWPKTLGIYWISSFLGLFLPATVGGDALRAYALASRGYNASDAISSILVERVLGFGALFVFALFSLGASFAVLGRRHISNIESIFWLFLALLVVLAALFYGSVNERIANYVKPVVRGLAVRIRVGTVAQKMGQVYHSYYSYRAHPWHLTLFFVLSLVENLLPLWWTYCLALAFGMQIPLLYFFVLLPIVLVLVRLPISLDGIGLQEGAFVFFLTQVGVAHTDAFLLGLASHILAVISILPGGVFYAIGGLGFSLSEDRSATVVNNPLEEPG